MLATTHALPFPTRIGHDTGAKISSGVDIPLILTTRSESVSGRADDILRAFYSLANAGAMGGPIVSPGESGLNEVTRLMPNKWLLREPRLDPRAIVVLANWLRAADPGQSIESLQIGSAPSEALAQTIGAQQYPPLAASRTCTVEMQEPIGSDVRVIFQAARPLTEAEGEELLARLCTCATAISMGAYCEYPDLDHPFGCTFEDAFDLVAGDPAFCLWRLRADSAAVIGLVHVCQAFCDSQGVSAHVVVEG